MLSIIGLIMCLTALVISLGRQTLQPIHTLKSTKYKVLFSSTKKRLAELTNGLDQKLLTTSISLGVIIATILYILVHSLLFGLLGMAATIYGALITAAKRRTQHLESEALSSWPTILSELGLRIGAMGAPLPLAFFSAGRTAPRQIALAFEHAERTFGITGSFDGALKTLRNRMCDRGTAVVVELLSVVKDAPGTDVTRLVEELRLDRLAEKDRVEDYRAKLAGVKFARYFVLIVPIGMMLAGTTIAGLAPFRTSFGLYALVIAGLILVICWTWATKLAGTSDVH